VRVVIVERPEPERRELALDSGEIRVGQRVFTDRSAVLVIPRGAVTEVQGELERRLGEVPLARVFLLESLPSLVHGELAPGLTIDILAVVGHENASLDLGARS